VEKGKGEGEDAAMFSDFGEMVEYDVIGGTLELYPEKRGAPAFCVDHLIPCTPIRWPGRGTSCRSRTRLPDNRRPARAAPRRSP
jgi:hypothetical protein